MKHLILLPLLLMIACNQDEPSYPTNNNPPPKVVSWSLQYNGAIQYHNVDYCIYDAFNFTKPQLDKAKCKKIAYFNLHYQVKRLYSEKFLKECIGKPLDDGKWDGENALNLSTNKCIDNWKHIMELRVIEAKRKGFIGIDGDNIDVFARQPNGSKNIKKWEDFKWEYSIKFWKILKQLGDKHGMIVGLKNSSPIISKTNADFYMVEQCQQYNECSTYFNGKPIFDIEYQNRYCKPHAGVYVIQKDVDEMGRERKVCQ